MTKWLSVLVIALLIVLASANLLAAEDVQGKAFKAAGPIVIDGDAAEWAEVIKPENALASNKPMVEAYVQWDEAALYFLVKVADTNFIVGTQGSFWNTDCVELFLDGNNTKKSGYDKSCAQFWFCLNNDGTTVYIGQWHRPGDAIDSSIFGGKVPDLEAAVAITKGTGYVMEIKIPAKNLKLDALAAGKQIGFNYTVNDTASGNFYWSAGKNVNTFEKPKTWGTVTLQ